MNQPTPYLAGMSTIDMTPPVGTPLAGFSHRGFHSSVGVDHPLRAVALSLGDGATDVVVVSVELVGLQDDLPDRIAAEVGERLGLQRSQILLNATHTHCGPAMRDNDVHTHGWIDEAYREELIGRLVTLAERAHHHRVPVRLERAVGRCGIAMNRRRPDPEAPGRVGRAMAPHPEGPSDHDVPVLVLRGEDGGIRGVVASYACHPTSRNGLWIGGDFVSYAVDALADATAAQAMVLQGCAGDQKPRPADPSSAVFGIRTREQVAALGHELADAALAAMTDAVPVAGAIRTAFGTIPLRTEEVDRERVRRLADSSLPHERRWSQTWQRKLADGEATTSEADLVAQVISVGEDVAVVALGGEMTVEHGLRLKRELGGRFAQVVPLGYSNGLVGYVPVARQFDEYGYEVIDANTFRRYAGRWARDTEDQIHGAVAGLVDGLA